MAWHNLLLKLTVSSGRLEGESAVKGYEKYIEVDSLGFDISTPEADVAREQQQERIDSGEVGNRFEATRRLLAQRMEKRSVTRAVFSPLKLNKRFDKSSTGLLRALSSQEVITEAAFVALRRSELGTTTLKVVPWLLVTLKGAKILSVDIKMEGSGNLTQLNEEVKLDYDELAVEYRPERVAGTLRFSYVRASHG